MTLSAFPVNLFRLVHGFSAAMMKACMPGAELDRGPRPGMTTSRHRRHPGVAEAVHSMLLSLVDPQTTLVDPRTGTELKQKAFVERVAERAGSLKRLGIGNGQCVVVARRKPLDYLGDLFALWEAGAMAVAVNPAITEEERGNVMRATGASLLLDDGPLRIADAARAGATPSSVMHGTSSRRRRLQAAAPGGGPGQRPGWHCGWPALPASGRTSRP